ncbi:hypothetical protein B0H10DRAFT_2195533 [Mycena sp. CBHHK59/15]|nr:hypothetical protein B0H10DRAFT_2195533 [Mycena sp. CBHHK59/15]
MPFVTIYTSILRRVTSRTTFAKADLAMVPREALLLNGFRHPHTILNLYVEAATKFCPDDADEFVVSEGDDCEGDEVHILALNPGFFTGWYGRFVDSRLTQVVMDEPLFIISAARWLCEEPREFWDPVTKAIVYPPHNWFTPSGVLHRRGFDKGHKISKVFSFPHKPIPAWANQKAELVGLERTARDSDGASDEPFSSNPIAIIPDTLGDISSWVDEKARPAFCLPSTLNPDLLFVLKLTNGSFVRVILHAAASDSVLEGTTLKKMIKRLDLKSMFLDEDDASVSPERDALIQKFLKPKTLARSDETRVLRVIASFPAKTHLKTGNPKSSKGMIANLNTGLFEKLTEDIAVADVFDRILAAATLGEVKLPIGAGKRKAPADDLASASRKRRRLDIILEEMDRPQFLDSHHTEGGKLGLGFWDVLKSRRRMNLSGPAGRFLPTGVFDRLALCVVEAR